MDVPVVKLAGKEYNVPFLVPIQNEVVMPLIFQFGKSIKTFIGDFVNGKAEAWPSDQYAAILTVVYWGAIWPNDNAAKPDSIKYLPVTYAELIRAWDEIQYQTGMFARPGEASEDASGEAQAGALKK